MIRAIIIFLVSILLISSPVRAAETNAADISGEWIGTWTSLNSPTYNGVIEMYINNEGNNVDGISVIGNTKCFPERVFKGNLSGKYNNFIEFKLAPVENPEDSFAENWGAINRSRNAISVVYSFDKPNSECYGDVGTMFISKIQPYSSIQGITKK
ncbi:MULTISPECIES: hypothetical protein [unclassified Okeania]|uniref:hypothetical protein n=1 Tax=unclassified Okeania TaxID=2634635 RepID=UPI0013C09CFA|nr:MULTISPECIES: hypothetical protein [unclassified Okeania]NEN87462.1 hypothetical protein [Okeania sp. SIO3H1]NET26887.1 hypothetical protein [Okeania sp. SIO1I7]NET41476.1 hypothetical protein [Okeania sp. SIO2B3]